MKSTKKIHYRIVEDDRERWLHFCYVSNSLKILFDKYINTLNKPSNYWILKWANEDFGISEIDTVDDLDNLKVSIKQKYKDKYPEIYIESATDSQGWLRVWYNNHMKKELNYIGK